MHNCGLQEGYIIQLLKDSSNNCTDAHLIADRFGDNDVSFLIDFDTAWMGDEPDEYEKHVDAIRAESSHLNDADFRSQRLKVGARVCRRRPPPSPPFCVLQLLQLFIQIPNIFATRAFRERYEVKARRNIDVEIKKLKAASS